MALGLWISQVIHDRVFLRLRSFPEGLPDDRQKFGIVHRLLQKGLGARLSHTFQVVANLAAGDHDNRHPGQAGIFLNLSIRRKPSPAGSPRSRMMRSGSLLRASAMHEIASDAAEVS